MQSKCKKVTNSIDRLYEDAESDNQEIDSKTKTEQLIKKMSEVDAAVRLISKEIYDLQ